MGKIKNYIKVYLLLWLLPIVGFANINIGGVINDYAKVTSVSFPNCDDICDTVRPCLNQIQLNSATAFQKGDKALIIQMKGASINTSNTNAGGTITNIGNAGNYEFITIRDIVGNTIYPLRQLTKTYDVAGLIQLVRIPNYNDDVTVTSTLEALPWNPTTGLGGVLALFVNGDLTLNANLNVNGMGYVGEVVNVNGTPDGCGLNPSLQFIAPAANGDVSPKGNGIVVNDPNTNGGRAPRANGGGGGVSGDTGGGGGSNYGAGGNGGNRWCDYNTAAGGIGGLSLQPYLPLNKVFLGGAGGPGFITNNNSAEAANGGGIIVVKADNLIANNRTLNASGTSPSAPGSGIDGGGGGGAGGTVALSVDNITGNLTVDVSGGNGQGLLTATLHGPGGGGGGGALLHNLGTLPANVAVDFNGGTSGKHGGSNSNNSNGAQDGMPGGVVFIPNIIRDYEIGIVTSTDAVCGCNGSINFAGFSSTGVMQYSINAGNNYQTSPNFSGVCEGTYEVQAVDESGCIYNATVVILNNAYQLPIDLGNNEFICSGGSTQIGLTNNASYNYSWNTGATSSQITVNTIGDYILTATDANECTGSDTIAVNLSTPTVALPTNFSLCSNEFPTVIVPITSSTNATFLWSTSATTSTINVTSGGTYSVTITDSIGCTANDAITVTEHSMPTLSLGIDKTICFGSSTVVGPTSSQGHSYNWNNGVNSSQQTITASGEYVLTQTNSNGCSVSDTIQVTVLNQITTTLTAQNISCYNGDNGTINSSTTGGGNTYNYLWSNNETTQNITNLSADTYNVTITDEFGCTSTSSETITEPAALTATTSGTNANCYNENGAASVTINGGTTPYTYLWSNGSTISSISAIAGNYYVVITDANGCTETAIATVSQPTQLATNLSVTNAECFGENGSITSTTNGGTGNYTNAWSNGATTQNITATAGSYTLTVTDENGCTVSQSATIDEPIDLTMNITAEDANCFGENGSATATAAGGIAPYSYAWDNGTNTNNISATEGTYNLTITDANGCTETATATISQPTELTTNLSVTNANCFGENGSIISTTSGGKGDYTYLWSNGETTQNITATAGNYTLTVADENGCTVSQSATIDEPTDITINITAEDANCFGENGSATATAAGGIAPYTYAWDNGANSNNISANAGTYNLTITDANGCTETATTTISQPTELTTNLSVTNANCFGENGSIISTTSGGNGDYTYLWSNGETTQNITATAGNYTLTITDENGCTVSESATIGEPSILMATTSVVNAICFNENGSAAVAVSGGTTPYNYNWNNANTTENITAPAGTYSVTITDANNCIATTSATIDEPTDLTININTEDANCFGENGSAAATAAGGIAPYTYAWDNGANTNSISANAGTYNLTITDANGCTETATATISQPTQPVTNLSVTNAECFGENGSINSATNGGTGDYTYLWSNGETTQNITATAGNYTLTITDENNCSINASATIDEPGTLTASISKNDILCFNGTTTATALSSGGTGSVSFEWSNGQSTVTANNLNSGVHEVTVTDANGCTANANITINQPDELNLNLATINAVCFGENTTLSSAVIGGVAPYNYSWSNGSTTPNLTTTPGSYTLIVSDANGCTKSATAITTQPDELSVNTIVSNANCFGQNGTIDATVNGGTGSTSFIWSNGSYTNTITGPEGNYDVTVTDENGCTAKSDAEIFAPADLSVNILAENSACNGDLGTATANVAGGTSPYIYNWSNGETTSKIINLLPSNYNLTVTDANGCITSANSTITQPNEIVVTLTPTATTCFAEQNGAIATTITGGTGAYTYNWSNGETTNNLNDLAAGTYSLTITDENNCTLTTTTTVNQPTKLNGTISTTNTNCFNTNTASITSTITGGTPNYNYNWSNGSTNANLSNIAANTYTLMVTDANGCTWDTSATITQPSQLQATINANPLSCFNGSNGSAVVNTSGGTSPYNYSWNNGDSTTQINNQKAGIYDVEITDAKGCAVTKQIEILQPEPLISTLTSTAASCHDKNDGKIEALTAGGTPPYSYEWSADLTNQNEPSVITNIGKGDYNLSVYDVNGCTTTETTQVTAPDPLTVGTIADPTYCGLPLGQAIAMVISGGTTPYDYQWEIYTQTVQNDTASNLFEGAYEVAVTDANGCTTTQIAEVKDVSIGGIVNGNIKNVSCYGGNDGAASVTFNGKAVQPYTYTWENQTTGTTHYINNSGAYGLYAGTHIVTMVDANGCIFKSEPIIIEQPEPLLLTENVQNATCYEGCNGSIKVDVVGGTKPYEYTWNQPAFGDTSVATNLCFGNYNVTVKDAKGCALSEFFQITQPTKIEIELTSYDEHCNLSDGKMESEVKGGILPYRYRWNTGAVTPVIESLSADTFTLTVTDANNCEMPETERIITTPPPVMTLLNKQNATCFNNCDGLAEVQLIGALGNVNYQWSNNTTAPIVANLCAGSYDVIGTDVFGCKDSISIEINQPEPLSYEINYSEPTCFNNCDAAATASVSGGTQPYSYSWINNGTEISTSKTAANICAKTYQLNITDVNNCNINGEQTINNPPKILFEVNSTPVSCYNACDGTLSATPLSGNGEFTYTWIGEDTIKTQNPTNLCAGQYTLNITNNLGCVFNDTVTINEPDSLIFKNSKTDVSCFDLNDGLITTTVQGGNGNYTYSWSNGATTANINNLAANNYTLAVTDAKNCAATAAIVISQPTILTATTSVTNATCRDACNGSTIAIATGGTAPYFYNWFNAKADSNSATQLCKGEYEVQITDNNGCTVTNDFSVDEPQAIQLTSIVKPSNCGKATGELQVAVTGGFAPYDYSWSNGENTSTIGNLVAGCYALTVTDANGCSIDTTLCIDDILSPTLTVTDSLQISCFNGNDGTFNFSAQGGSGNLFTWVDDGTDTISRNASNVNNLTAGCYAIHVLDEAGCTASKTICLTQPSQLTANLTLTNDVSCYNACDAEFTVTANGATPPYTYNWSNNATSTTTKNWCAGIAQVTVTDNNSCSITIKDTVLQPAPLQIAQLNADSAQCYNTATGALNSEVKGGTPPYNYFWDGIEGETNKDYLAAGNYDLKVTDVNGCSSTASTSIFEPEPIILNYSTNNTTCGLCNGSAVITATGGNGAYTYDWMGAGDNTASSVNTNLCADTFKIVVSDQNTCSNEITIIVGADSVPLIDSLITSNAKCATSFDGSIVPFVTGVAPFTYQWDQQGSGTASTDSVLTNIGVGNYCLQVTDANGCAANACTNLDFPTPVEVLYQADTQMCYGNSNQIWLTATGGNTGYTYHWTNDEFEGPGPHNLDATTAKNYCFYATDSNNCTSPVQCISTNVSNKISIWTSEDRVLCEGQTFGAIGYTSGGNGDSVQVKVYRNAPDTGEEIDFTREGNKFVFTDLPLTTTTYYIVAHDGCSADAIDSVTAIVNLAPEVNISVSDTAGCVPFNVPFQLTTNIPNPIFEIDYDGDGEIDFIGPEPTFDYTYTKAGIYKIQVNVISPDSCSTKATTFGFVVAQALPEISFKITDNKTPSMNNPEVSFEAVYENGSLFHWNFGDGDSISGVENDWITTEEHTRNQIQAPVHTYRDSGWFDVTAILTSRSGCKSEYTLPIYVQPAFSFYSPNAFTPNNDGTNDIFLPVGIGWHTRDYSFSVWNRWGENIFNSQDKFAGWDGTYMGREVQQGVYVWRVIVRDIVTNQRHEYTGHVSLLRD